MVGEVEEGVGDLPVCSTNDIGQFINYSGRSDPLLPHGASDYEFGSYRELMQRKLKDSKRDPKSGALFVTQLIRQFHPLYFNYNVDESRPKIKVTEMVLSGLDSRDKKYLVDLLDIYSRYINEQSVVAKSKGEIFPYEKFLGVAALMNGWLTE
jgi:hypothetical protein